MRGLSQFALPVLTLLAAVGMLAILSDFADRRRRRGPYLATFRYGFFLQFFAFFSAFMVPVSLIVLGTFVRLPRDEMRYFIAGYLLFTALGLPMFWESHRYFLGVTTNGLEQRSPWRGWRSIAWDDIAAIRYSPINWWFVVHAADGQKIRIGNMIGGLNEWLACVEQHVAPEALKPARSGYTRLGRPFPPQPDEPILEARAPLGQR